MNEDNSYTEELPPENRLNELSAQEWLRFTKTWFVHNPPPRKKDELLHPAKYPEKMVEEFIKFFTKTGAVVLDPFLGTGSTLVACYNTKRNGIGIELQKKYVQIARERIKRLDAQFQLAQEGAKQYCKQIVVRGDSSKINELWKEYNLPKIDFIITSPPYGPMLNKKGLVTREREEQGLDLKYSKDENDLGNACSYEEFLSRLVDIFVKIKPLLKEGAYLAVVLQNYMDKGNYITLAWDFAKEMSKHYQLRGERLWLQDNKTLYPYGYKYSFVPNVHHHYCLIFKHDKN
ncbi:site-specific DNA-methyltransferase [Candidatus Woesearchaeota archaeon]|nr:site-specific DNA-methyltransferase [Candidatus Woesearchaeota archaeon]